MRLWTIHPRYLDSRGLAAAWREGLLAQKVLMGRTQGYRNHPQLERFRAHSDPLAMVVTYLQMLHEESLDRNYRFDLTKIESAPACTCVEETEGQLLFEWHHLLRKLEARSPSVYQEIRSIKLPDAHPLFTIVPGLKRPWERS